MSEPPDKPAGQRDGWMMVLYGLLLAAGVALLCLGVVRALDGGDMALVGLGALAVIVPAALYPIASALTGGRGAGSSDGGSPLAQPPAGEVLEQLRLINERLMLSDSAKQIAYRATERHALRQAIRDELDRGDFDTALGLVEQMIGTYGSHVEAEEFRAEILTARTQWMEKAIDEATAKVEQLVARTDWPHARVEAQKILRQFPDAPCAAGLERRVEDAREKYKHDLTKDFLESAARDDVETAMQLLGDLDIYLSEHEAAPFREAARGVITKKRTNLGVQFKLAVHDHDWTAALQIGSEIVESFPNSKMAEEVRRMKKLLEARAAETP